MSVTPILGGQEDCSLDYIVRPSKKKRKHLNVCIQLRSLGYLWQNIIFLKKMKTTKRKHGQDVIRGASTQGNSFLEVDCWSEFLHSFDRHCLTALCRDTHSLPPPVLCEWCHWQSRMPFCGLPCSCTLYLCKHLILYFKKRESSLNTDIKCSLWNIRQRKHRVKLVQCADICA